MNHGAQQELDPESQTIVNTHVIETQQNPLKMKLVAIVSACVLSLVCIHYVNNNYSHSTKMQRSLLGILNMGGTEHYQQFNFDDGGYNFLDKINVWIDDSSPVEESKTSDQLFVRKIEAWNVLAHGAWQWTFKPGMLDPTDTYERITKTLIDRDSQIIALQEVETKLIESLRDNGYTVYSFFDAKDKEIQGKNLLTRGIPLEDRPIETLKPFDVSASPAIAVKNDIASKIKMLEVHSFFMNACKGFVAVELPGNLILVSVHLDFKPSGAATIRGKKQLEYMMEWAYSKYQDKKVMIMGDFNMKDEILDEVVQNMNLKIKNPSFQSLKFSEDDNKYRYLEGDVRDRVVAEIKYHNEDGKNNDVIDHALLYNFGEMVRRIKFKTVEGTVPKKKHRSGDLADFLSDHPAVAVEIIVS